MDHDDVVVLEREDDPLAEPLDVADMFAEHLANGRNRGAQHEGRSEPNVLEDAPLRALREALDVHGDVRQLRHARSIATLLSRGARAS